MIYHMVPVGRWISRSDETLYHADSLATEGFIHCTAERDQLLTVANRFYQSEEGPFVILALDEARIDAEVRWEPADGHIFPHIYGPLNVDAVVDVIDFPRGPDGMFVRPLHWNHA